jgi:glycosyltransferase involved in cell wall biosynthesis
MSSQRPQVIYVQYTNPAGYPPLEHSSRIFAEAGWDVLFLGTGADGAAANLRFSPNPRIKVRLLKFRQPGWRQKVQYVLFSLWITACILFKRPRAVYVSDTLSCGAAIFCALIPGLKLLYHEHDSPSAPRSRFDRFLRWSRRLIARKAALCILPNERRIQQFKAETQTSRPVYCVWNCPARHDAAETAAKAPEFIVYYHGSVVPARIPVAVVTALKDLPREVSLVVAGYETVGHYGYIDQLRGEASRCGVEDRIRFLGALSRHQLLPECRRASVGLALMPMNSPDLNEHAMTGASNKPFEYMACGLALLVSDLKDWHRMFVHPGYALACNPGEPQSVAAALRWFYEHASQTRAMGENGRMAILNELNYEAQFAPVLNFLAGKAS